MTIHQNPRDKQPPHTGKVENDTNKLGEQDPTQINQGKRTPESRSDRESHVGGSNQLWMTKTPANYFVRDVVEIVVSTEDVAPATPGAADEHPNSPNAGVLAGTQG